MSDSRKRVTVTLVVSAFAASAACASSRPAAVEPDPAPETPSTRQAPSQDGPPSTRREPVKDVYHSTEVSDDYRWLEDGTSAEVKAWIAAQNAYARGALDTLPGRAEIEARLSAILRDERPRYPWVEVAGGRWFVLVEQPPKQQAFVVTMPAGASPDDGAVLVDPNVLDPSGKTAIDWFVPSPKGDRLAVSLSKAGTEMGDVSLVDVATGKPVGETIPRVNGGTAGGDLAWTADGSGFYYTRYPRPGERSGDDLHFYQQLYFHRLGTPPESDRYELGRELPRIAEIQIDVDEATDRVLATVQRGDGGEFAHFLRSAQGAWRQFSDFGDKLVEAVFMPGDDDLFVVTRQRSPRGELLRLDGRSLDVSRAKVVLAPAEDTLVSDFWGDRTLLATNDRLYATYQLGGPSTIRAFSRTGTPAPWKLPVEVASFSGLTTDGAGRVLFRGETFVSPQRWYRFDEKSRVVEATRLASTSAVDMSRYEVVREFATSKDGTRVPVNVLSPSGTARTGTAPCVVTGYGGYGRSLGPRFVAENAVWLEHGVTFAIANLRGGGEYGEEWHRAGNLENKQNVFDDFAAVIEHLKQQRFCAPDRVGIIGGSNGGLLMGATMVQHPEMIRAVVSFVGIYDMLRVENSPNGAFNVTEFGTVKDPAQFRALHAYSPYHGVEDGVVYPATLFLTGENDPRVDPMQSRKMTARLQAATAGDAPILLLTSLDTGHGGDTDLEERIAQKTNAMTFMLNALGVTPTDGSR